MAFVYASTSMVVVGVFEYILRLWLSMVVVVVDVRGGVSVVAGESEMIKRVIVIA